MNEMKEEFDFRDLLRKPDKLFGYLYIYFLVVLVFLGLYYGWSLTDVGKNAVQAAALRDSSAFVRDIPLQAARVIPPVNVMEVGIPSAELLAKGNDLYQANCASCHGDRGQGNGPAGLLLNPPPRNFMNADGWRNGAKVSQIYRTLEEGIIRSGMPSYNYMPPADRFAITHVVRSFHPSPPVDSDTDLQELETSYQLSRGMVVPARIPVRRAAEFLLTDQQPRMMKLSIARSRFEADKGITGARLLGQLSRETDQMLLCLVVPDRPFTSFNDFIRVVCADPVSIGIDPAVTQLTEEEWSEVYRYIVQLSNSIDGGS